MRSLINRFIDNSRQTLLLGMLVLVIGYPLLTVGSHAPPAPLLELRGGATAFADIHKIITCHLVHFTSSHLFLDLTMFLLLGSICERQTGKWYRLLLLFFATSVGTGIAMLLPDGAGYRGLSGVVTAQCMFVLVVFGGRAFRNKNLSAIMILASAAAGLAFKFVFEGVTKVAMFSYDMNTNGIIPSPAAHLLGASAGVICGLIWEMRNCRTRDNVNRKEHIKMLGASS